MEDMEPPGWPDPARVVIFNMSPLANLPRSDRFLRDLSSNLSASNLFPLIDHLHSSNGNHTDHGVRSSQALIAKYS
jgi:hypothetical protein